MQTRNKPLHLGKGVAWSGNWEAGTGDDPRPGGEIAKLKEASGDLGTGTFQVAIDTIAFAVHGIQ